MKTLQLKSREERRIRAGHLWVFSNEIDVKATPIKAFEPGECVTVLGAKGRPLGSAYVNPKSLIAARLYSREKARELDADLLRERLTQALALRQRCYPSAHYRWVHGEGDALPGLVVDRYDAVAVAQITTAGMDRLSDVVVGLLSEFSGIECVVLRNDVSVRELEGLNQGIRVAWGELPERVWVEEAGARFQIDPIEGQKTGWFYDQAENRRWLMPRIRGARVLDLYAYLGGWGVGAAVHGAERVVAVDASAAAAEGIARNAAHNGVEGWVKSECGDALEVLKSLRAKGQQFDVVVVDPPALIKRKKDLEAGQGLYRYLNQAALQVLAPGGIMISCSCSHHLSSDMLQRILRQSLNAQGKQGQFLFHGYQGPDHPQQVAMPETTYLKAFACRQVG